MSIAFVLINTETGFMDRVLKALGQLEGVKEAYSVYGVYDIVAKVETETTGQLKDIVTSMRKLGNVRTTLTMIVVELTESDRM